MTGQTNAGQTPAPTGPIGHRVVIVGGGFGGLCAAKALRKAPVSVTLVDQRNHHLFQPLLYQVATGGLSPANIASPLRTILKKGRNTRVVLGRVDGFDLDRRTVRVEDGEELEYDSLIVATGSGSHYFGNDSWERWAPSLKTLEDSTRIRRRVLLAFERAERSEDPREIARLLTFTVVGGGPTGVELAGALAEVSRGTLLGEFRHIDPSKARIVLIEGSDRLLQGMPEELSRRALDDLEGMGVDVRLGCFVQGVEQGVLTFQRAAADQAEAETLETETVLWAAGVKASPLAEDLARQTGAELDRGGRIAVGERCELPGRPNVFVIGDLARFEHGGDAPLPGLAPVAMQQGRFVARSIIDRLAGRTGAPFRYRDKGNMATIGRRLAVAQVGRLHFAGSIAWLAWLFIHLMYLAEFQNRVLVFLQWGWSYFTRNRGARLITAESVASRDVQFLALEDDSEPPNPD